MGIAAAVVTAALTLVGGAPIALADGDPASDVLVTYPLFNPADSAVPPATAERLEAVLEASARAGFPIRVALINSAFDLGTVTQFWSQPRGLRAANYAHYLWDELQDLYPGQVLVIMPGGIGLYGPKTGPHRLQAARESISVNAPAGGPGLADAAISAVPQLASADGHPFSVSDLHVARVTGSAGGEGLDVWAALAAGVLVLGGVWRWSLRARPLGAVGDGGRGAPAA